MFGMRSKRVAAAIAEPSNEYGPGSAAYSPEQTPGMAAVGFPETATVQDHPSIPGVGGSTSAAPAIHVPRPPSPSVYGEPGIANGLGYSTGLLPSRNFRNRFDGKTLVVPNMGAHPAEGPVGRSNRLGRLDSGVNALVDQWLPSQQQINETFVGKRPRNRNPLDDE